MEMDQESPQGNAKRTVYRLSQFHLIGSSSYHYRACLKFELDNTLVMMEKLMLPPISNNILLLQYLPISVVIEDLTWKQTFLVLNLIFGH